MSSPEEHLCAPDPAPGAPVLALLASQGVAVVNSESGLSPDTETRLVLTGG